MPSHGWICMGPMRESVREEDIWDLVERQGWVMEVDLRRHHSLAFAFVHFHRRRDARRTRHKLDGKRLLGGKPLRVFRGSTPCRSRSRHHDTSPWYYRDRSLSPDNHRRHQPHRSHSRHRRRSPPDAFERHQRHRSPSRTVQGGRKTRWDRSRSRSPLTIHLPTPNLVDKPLPTHQPLIEPRQRSPSPVPDWEPPQEPHLTPQQVYDQTVSIFEDVERDWLWSEVSGGRGLGDLVNFITDHPDQVPRVEKQGRKEEGETAGSEEQDYLSPPFRAPTEEYRKAAEQRLAFDFQQVSLPSLRCVLTGFGGRYAPAYAALRAELAQPVWKDRLARPKQRAQQFSTTRPLQPTKRFYHMPVYKLKILAIVRRFRQVPVASGSIQEEVSWVRRHLGDNSQVLLERENEGSSGALEECGICCEELETTSFAECPRGHRYCSICIGSQARETALGLGGGNVQCLEHGCGVAYGRSVLLAVLEPALFRQVEEAAGEQALAAAALSGLERCRWCLWGAVVGTPVEVDKVFRCGNKGECGRAVCRVCGKDWEELHFGRTCRELETEGEKRRRLEEALTAAVVRRCHKCALPFQKTEGCNKITCTCGAASCYLCLASDIDYDHFCRHLLRPGFPCSECEKCSLFKGAENTDANRIKAVIQANI